MKNWLELIPISARVHKRGSRMTRTCIALAVFLMAALFGMAERYLQGERAWQIRTYGSWQFTGNSDASQIYAVALFLALLVMAAAVLMISGSLNGNVLQRTEFFGMLRSLGATRRQILRYVRLEPSASASCRNHGHCAGILPARCGPAIPQPDADVCGGCDQQTAGIGKMPSINKSRERRKMQNEGKQIRRSHFF